MPDAFPHTDKTKTALITGVHPYHVPAFQSIFRSFPEVDLYPQNLEDFVTSPDDVRAWYDVLVFYNMHMQVPDDSAGGWYPAARRALEGLGETPQGLLVLHHALLAFPGWQLWNDLVGIEDRSFGYHIGETVTVQIADAEHPITRGLRDWTMIDETYTMADAGEGSHVLLTVDHPKSMKTIAWTRQHGQSRVLCLESGHDNDTYPDPSFRKVLERGIGWLAGRLA